MKAIGILAGVVVFGFLVFYLWEKSRVILADNIESENTIRENSIMQAIQALGPVPMSISGLADYNQKVQGIFQYYA